MHKLQTALTVTANKTLEQGEANASPRQTPRKIALKKPYLSIVEALTYQMFVQQSFSIFEQLTRLFFIENSVVPHWFSVVPQHRQPTLHCPTNNSQ
jgi:hypothetical protein